MHDEGANVDVLIVGAGPAGIAAAAALDDSGLSVLWIDQRERAGGAIHRQPVDSARKVRAPSSVRKQWQRLSAAMQAMKSQLSGGQNFLGLDADDLALIEDRRSGETRAIRARAIILALGAVERVLPRPGWQLPGVTTAGGMQVMLKETGQEPQGRILIAGSGPLCIALAAQLAAAGNPPVAVLEAGDPLRNPMHGAALLTHPRMMSEAAGALAVLARHRVPWRRGWRIEAIRQTGQSLLVECVSSGGRTHTVEADHVALHDGIRPNAFGLPVKGHSTLIVHAGDCREALGAVAAEADGHIAAKRVIAALTGKAIRPDTSAVDRERQAQAKLARLFKPLRQCLLAALPDDTVLCRCEKATVGDLRALVAGHPGISPREAKLNGRFAMGSCQGRFCADNAAALLAALQDNPVPPDAFSLTGRRWPTRPVPIASLIGRQDDQNDTVSK